MTGAEVKDKLEQATRLFVQADKDKNPSKIDNDPSEYTRGRFSRSR